LISPRAWAILPRLVTRTLAAAALSALLVAAAGCATPCEELGHRICACQTAGSARDACDRAVRSAVQSAHTTEEQQDKCDQLLGTCRNPDNDSTACDWMKTAEGKQACGLAY
jgi:hypothetical protein